MAFTPVEIRHVKPGRGLFGYKRAPVDRLLAEVADSFETVWRERADLTDRVDRLEDELVRYRDLDQLLRTTLVSAERAAHQVQDQAKRESDLILTEARNEAREIVRKAQSDHELLLGESRKIRSLLRAALDSIVDPGEPAGERHGDTKEHFSGQFGAEHQAA